MNFNPVLREMFGENTTKLAEMADKFFQSIGFPAVPAIFFEKSKFKLSDWPEGEQVGLHFGLHLSSTLLKQTVFV